MCDSGRLNPATTDFSSLPLQGIWVPIAANILETLEYPKVLARLARVCDYSLARERAEELLPETDVPPVRRMLTETTEARALLASIPEIGVGGARGGREPVPLPAPGGAPNPG